MAIPVRVLLAEDCEADAERTLCVLRASGYEPVARRVETDAAFSDALDEEVWDVILADHTMHRFSSLDALRIVTERHIDVPFLIVSGTISDGVAVALMRAGARDYILKSDLGRLPAAVSRELQDAKVCREAQRRQQEAEEKYRTLVEQIPAVTYVCEFSDGKMWASYLSPQIESITGRPASAWIGRVGLWFDAIHPEDREFVFEEFARTRETGDRFVAEYRLLAEGGRLVWLQDEARWFLDEVSGTQRLQGFLVDITEHKIAQETVQHLAFHDALTGLANRVSLNAQLDRAIECARADFKPLALLRLSLDRFREINNTLGHKNGEVVLLQVAERLSALEGTDVVSRLGSEEFAVLASATDAEEARRIADNAAKALQPPIVVRGIPVEVGVSVGIAMYPGHGEGSEDLMRCADVALDCARRSVEGSALYSRDQDPHDPRRLVLMGELRNAIGQGQLRLEYQPKIELESKRVVGVEALVRWRHPELGNVRPDEFIPIAEESTLIRPLTRWVLNEAFRQCSAWHRDGLEICMAINLSARNLHAPGLATQIEWLLETWGVSPEWFVLEITESAIMTDPDRARLVLERLSKRGLQISIDDFGTGYSSLAYLRRLPVSEVKIDRSFVIGLSSELGDLTIIRTIVALGHHLGLKVVAEGVEDAKTWNLLVSAGCDLAQGYYMARPMPAAEFKGWLSKADYGLSAIAKEPEPSD